MDKKETLSSSVTDNNLFSIMNSDSTFKFYRTLTKMTSKKFNPTITVIKEVPFLLVPTDNSYAIYSLDSLKLQFLGPYFPVISSIVQNGPFVYVASKSKIIRTIRGEITGEIELNCAEITEMIVFGTTMIIKNEKQLIVCEIEECEMINEKQVDLLGSKEIAEEETPFIKEQYRIDFDKEIKAVFHPNGYVNKVLILFKDGTAILYNTNSKKKIYEYNFGAVRSVAQTSLLDVIGVATEDGIIKIVNLKKDKIAFEIKEFKDKEIRRLHFKGKFAIILTNDMNIYDLEIKKTIYKKEDASSGLMINESMALITTASSIEILTIDDLKILKARRILNTNIKSISEFTSNELLMNTNEKIYKMNIYRDEMSTFLKNKHSVEILNSEPLNSNILIYGEGRLSYIDKNGKNHGFINLNCRFAKPFGDFCILGTKSSVLIMNMKSKRVVLKKEFDTEDVALDGCLDNNSFTLLFPKKICKYSIEGQELMEKSHNAIISKGRITERQGIYFISDESNPEEKRTVVISEQDGLNEEIFIRNFEVSKFALDQYSKILVGIKKNEIILYDIASGNRLDSIKTNKELKDIAILDKMKFILVLDSESHIHVLSSIQHFSNVLKNTAFGSVQSNASVPIKKQESTFYKELILYKNLGSIKDHYLIIKGLNSTEVNDLLDIIKKNLDKDLFATQKLLSKLIVYKASLIDPERLNDIKLKIDCKVKELEESLLKGISYLDLQNMC